MAGPAANSGADAAALLQQGFAAQAAGDWERAGAIARQVQRMLPRNAAPFYLAGLVALGQGDARKAVDALRQAAALGPDAAPLRVALGRAYLLGKAPGMAADQFRRAQALAPDLVEALEGLAEAQALDPAADPVDSLTLWQQVTALRPDRVEAWRNLAVCLHRLGRGEEALAAFDRAVALLPDPAAEPARSLANRAAVLIDLGRAGLACDLLRRAVTLEPDNRAFQRSFALALRLVGRIEPAVDLLTALTAADRSDAASWLDLGLAELARRNWQAAAAAFRAASAAGAEARAQYCLGEALRQAGDAAGAEAAYRAYLAADPADACGAQLGLGLLGVMPVPAAPPSAYVAQLFDDYADRFDTDLTKGLNYRGPELLRDLWQRRRGGAAVGRVLDLGCGTGLAAPLFRPLAGHLAGVDLSPRMVALAARRDLYDTLAVGEIVSHLEALPASSVDLLLAADVLVYLGDLRPLLRAAHRVLAPGGGFLFSVERAADPATAYHLHSGHRYAHGADALRAGLAEVGFIDCVMEEASTRDNAGKPVPGLLVLADR